MYSSKTWHVSLVLAALALISGCAPTSEEAASERSDSESSNSGYRAGASSDTAGDSSDSEGTETLAGTRSTSGPRKIVLAGGCFWCVEAVFEKMDGVGTVISGYAGGDLKDPTYKEVCSGDTGHAEVCEVTYDPDVLSMSDILDAFFATHDPTTLNRQGNDIGTQYRSAIFYSSEEQLAEVKKFMQKLDASGKFERPVVTTLEKLTTFYPAEEEHQDFYRRNPGQGYCRAVIPAKLKKLSDLLKQKSKDTQE
ncbi:MAG TPA: peptide-methionine (S)-S-oxide reductase [Planctomycetaceae bacterium]|nr:peptide-methionine (S)-S-oxide reductase [Planctomycetaceae bacterium]